DGMSQREQRDAIEAFRRGEFEVLVSTSVAEEGLDVPEVDLVLFFEPVSTAIRSIQRKGRTGRQAPGRVVVLVAEDTRDEAFFWISRRRERQMENELRALAERVDDIEQALAPEAEAAARRDPDQPSLEAFSVDDPDEDRHTTIIVDQRELDADIGRELSTREGVEVRLETLDVADYVLSDRVAVERKTVADFLDSLLGGDRDLFDQVGRLVRAYERPVVVLEGEGLYELRNVEPAAIRGALASLAVDFGASVLRTTDAAETRELLLAIATREQRDDQRPASAHGEKGGRTRTEQQEYVVSSIAEVGPVTARALLEALGSVEAVLTADRETLMSVEGVGEVTADRIREVVSATYEPD
ncbi:MAG: ERCC4 domain-containing protein, partial [Halobacteriota archaeon]